MAEMRPQNAEEMLEKIFAYMNRLVDEKEMSATIHILTDLGRTLVGADRASFWFWDRRKHQHWTIVALDHDKITVPEGKGIVGASIMNNETILLNEPDSDYRFNSSVDRQTGYVTKSILCMPVTGSEGNVIGAYQVINKLNPDGTDGRFDARDRERLALAAVYCGKTLESYLLTNEGHTDLVTKLRNRRGFYEYYNKRVLPFLYSHTASIVVGDIDFFHNINMIYGSGGGDEVLRNLADTIQYSINIDDEVIRFEDDTFVMILSNKTRDEALEFTKHLCRDIAETRTAFEGHSIEATMSFGVAELVYEKSSDENVEAAYQKMQQAKEAGRNTVR